MEKQRIICYIPCHYGLEYISQAIQSVHPFVEKIVILYTENPSYGHGTTMKCPETEMQLHDLCIASSNKVDWRKIEAGTEGQHRDYILNFAADYDGILAIDADEVLDPIDLPIALDLCQKTDKRYIGFAGYINFWKSFNYACYDGFTPIRYINLHNSGGEGVVPCKVYHFSTAQSIEIMRYKLEIHGHHDEIRPNWLTDVYEAWTPENNFTDLHLVAHGIWNATPFDKTQMPDILKAHPNYNKETIE